MCAGISQNDYYEDAVHVYIIEEFTRLQFACTGSHVQMACKVGPFFFFRISSLLCEDEEVIECLRVFPNTVILQR